MYRERKEGIDIVLNSDIFSNRGSLADRYRGELNSHCKERCIGTCLCIIMVAWKAFWYQHAGVLSSGSSVCVFLPSEH